MRIEVEERNWAGNYRYAALCSEIVAHVNYLAS
jgi:hypothetical protein